METPEQILANALQRARKSLQQPIVTEAKIEERIAYVARCLSNRAGARMLLTCALAKVARPEVDIRKPYTEIGDTDTFSGRAEYDEAYVGPFAAQHQLPLNTTTAFLTPGFRTINVPLAPPLIISGRPKKMYKNVIQLLDDVFEGRISAESLLTEVLRQLLLLKQEQEGRIQQLIRELATNTGGIQLSSEEIVELMAQHLRSPKSSRLPVLVVAAIYRTISARLGEQIRSLWAHNAADLQTGALGDIEVFVIDTDELVTVYEMKTRRVTKADIDLAVEKLATSETRIENYIFVTTEKIDLGVADYAASLYRQIGGIEFVVLDCLGFLRHFLHLFHRLRLDFLEAYQALVLDEPDSAVSQPLKEVFLSLRRVAEMDDTH